MCILLSHDCLMLLVAVPFLSLFRQLEASSRRESWYLYWGFQTDHKQEELLPGLRQPATIQTLFIVLWEKWTGSDSGYQFNRWGFLCVFCVPQGLTGCITKCSTNTHSSFSDWSGKMFHLHLALECVPVDSWLQKWIPVAAWLAESSSAWGQRCLLVSSSNQKNTAGQTSDVRLKMIIK